MGRRIRLVLSGAALLALSGFPPARAASTVEVPLTIDSTGTVDVTGPLNSFIAGVPDGSTIAFHENGRYRVEGTVIAANKHGLTFQGNGATLLASTRGGPTRAHLAFRGGGPVSVSDLNVLGPNSGNGYDPEVQWQAGFEFDGVQGVTLDHVAARNVFGDFVYLGEDMSPASLI